MRRLLSSLLAASALLAAGCGGGDSGSALDEALAYLPKDALVAAALDTDLEGDQYRALDRLLDEFPFSDQIRGQLREQLEQATDGRFAEDVRPLLGNPVVIGASGSGAESDPVVVMKAADKDELDALVERRKPRRLGEAAGATMYQDDDTAFAVEDDVIVFGTDERRLAAALERADGDDHLDEETFDSGLDGLPEDALVRVYADLEAVLRNDAANADALKIEWVNALRKLGVTAVAREGGIDVDFRVTTEGDLSDEDLPIAPGEESPGVIERDGEVGLGIRDLAHIVSFAETAGQAIDPAGFGDYAQAKKTIDNQLGISLDDDLVGQLTGDTSASVAPDGGFGVRAELKDPQAFEETLEKVSDVLPSFAEGAGFGEVELGNVDGQNTLWVLTSRETGGQVVYGVMNDVLVVASSAQRAQQLAAQDPVAVPDARGSAVLGADAEQLANVLIAEFGSMFGIPDLGGLGTGLITGPLGDLNGSLSASTGELRGKLTLTVD